jgi:hypothetical protein
MIGVSAIATAAFSIKVELEKVGFQGTYCQEAQI